MQKRSRSILRWSLLAVLCLPVFIVALALLSSIQTQRSVQAVLSALRTLRVQRSSGSDVAKALERLNSTVHACRGTSDPCEISLPIKDCEATDCHLVFGTAMWADQGWLIELQLRYPRIRKWVPLNSFLVELTVKEGVLSEMYVREESAAAATLTEARVTIDTEERAPWSVRRHDGIIEGAIFGEVDAIEIRATRLATPARLDHALDFDVACLGIFKHCSPCQFHSFACEEYERGDWYDFELASPVLAQFRDTVNDLPMGTTLGRIAKMFERPIVGEQRAHPVDCLPYCFPDGTVFGDENPRRVTFFVKKWRAWPEATDTKKDQGVTFVFDGEEKLQRIESQVVGISSRSR